MRLIEIADLVYGVGDRVASLREGRRPLGALDLADATLDSPVARKRCRTVRGDKPRDRPRNTVSTSGSRISTPLRTSLSTNVSTFS